MDYFPPGRKASSRIASALRQFYAVAREHFGYIATWWPGTPTELTITAVLVQQCDWTVAWEAAKRLRQTGLLELGRLAQADAATVRGLVYPVAFYSQKSGRLIQIARAICERGHTTVESLLRDTPTAEARQFLLALNGIGPETADSILLFASDRHETFVVDAYARRVFQRLQLFDGCDEAFWLQPYERLRRFFLDHITPHVAAYDGIPLAPGVPRTVALLRDFHAQIVEVGRHHCRNPKPRCRQPGRRGWHDHGGEFVFCEQHCAQNGCRGCPLAGVCAFCAEAVSKSETRSTKYETNTKCQ